MNKVLIATAAAAIIAPTALLASPVANAYCLPFVGCYGPAVPNPTAPNPLGAPNLPAMPAAPALPAPAVAAPPALPLPPPIPAAPVAAPALVAPPIPANAFPPPMPEVPALVVPAVAPAVPPPVAPAIPAAASVPDVAPPLTSGGIPLPPPIPAAPPPPIPLKAPAPPSGPGEPVSVPQPDVPVMPGTEENATLAVPAAAAAPPAVPAQVADNGIPLVNPTCYFPSPTCQPTPAVPAVPAAALVTPPDESSPAGLAPPVQGVPLSVPPPVQEPNPVVLAGPGSTPADNPMAPEPAAAPAVEPAAALAAAPPAPAPVAGAPGSTANGGTALCGVGYLANPTCNPNAAPGVSGPVPYYSATDCPGTFAAAYGECAAPGHPSIQGGANETPTPAFTPSTSAPAAPAAVPAAIPAPAPMQLCGYGYAGSCAPPGTPDPEGWNPPVVPDTAPVTDPNVGVPTQQLGLPDAGPAPDAGPPGPNPNASPQPAQGPCQSGAPVAADGSCGPATIPLDAPGNPDQPLPATNVPQNAPPGDMNALTNPTSNGQIPPGSPEVAQNGGNDASSNPASPLAPGTALPGTNIPANNTDYSACSALAPGVKQNCLYNAYYWSHQGTAPTGTDGAPAGWQPALPYVAPTPPPDISTLPVGTEVSTIPLNPDGTQQAGWVADAQTGPNYGHYIRQTDAAASGCTNNTGDHLTACINSAMANYADNNGIGAGANLECLHNRSQCVVPVIGNGQTNQQQTTTGTNSTHLGNFELTDPTTGQGMGPGQIPGAVPGQ
jgi:hypothetical protein